MLGEERVDLDAAVLEVAPGREGLGGRGVVRLARGGGGLSPAAEATALLPLLLHREVLAERQVADHLAVREDDLVG